jgi:hypothetical protein
MGVTWCAYVLYGLRLTMNDFMTPVKVQVGDFCKCPENDRNRKYCSECGNRNKTKYLENMGFHPAVVSEYGNIESICVGDNVYKIHHGDNNGKCEDYYVLCIPELSCSQYDCYKPLSLCLDGEYENMMRAQFEKDMKSIGFWKEQAFGTYLVMEAH